VKKTGILLAAGVFLVLAASLAGCSPLVTPSPSRSHLIGTWRHGSSSTITISQSGTVVFTNIPRGVLVGDQTHAYGEPLDVVGTWDSTSNGPLPTLQTNGGTYDRVLEVHPLESDKSAWPIDGVNLEIDTNGHSFEIRMPLGDPDSDAWYTFEH